ncbi:MAG: hypothetical protein ED859_09680 [Desulfuromonadales bacterium]|nr:MAG: hypothetical protein ED859_09680 [Desulfuromonadales bacterium]
MKNPTVTPTLEQSPERVTLDIFRFPYSDDLPLQVEAFDITGWSSDDYREFRAFLEVRRSAPLPSREVW